MSQNTLPHEQLDALQHVYKIRPKIVCFFCCKSFKSFAKSTRYQDQSAIKTAQFRSEIAMLDTI